MKHHDRPWKCSIQDCVYAEGGFLSRKMRDDHYKDHLATGPQEIPHAENLDPEEIQPLLFDLVRADKVEAVRNLLCQFEALPMEIKIAIRECAASFGSVAMIDLIEPFEQNSFPDNTIRSSIRAGNIDLLNHLLMRSKNCKLSIYNYRQSIFSEVLGSDSEGAFETLLSHIESDFNTRRHLVSRWSGIVTHLTTIRATAGHPEREKLLINLWETAGVPKLSNVILSSVFVDVVSSTCSIKLAEYLVGHGAKVNSRPNETHLTPLQHAARKTSAAAAEMMKYLLLQGADPELKPRRTRLSIRDEKGAKGISKWLGMSWDELVAKTKLERENIASRSIESVG